MPGLKSLPLGSELLHWALEMCEMKREPVLLKGSQSKHQSGKGREVEGGTIEMLML